MKTRMPQLLITCPEYAHKIFVTEFRRFHDNEFSRFVSKEKYRLLSRSNRVLFRQSNDKVDKILANNPFVLLGEKWKERRAEITPGLTANRVGQLEYPFQL